MEITDDKLLRIALVTALIGIIGLIIFTPTIEVKEVSIKDINRGMIDEQLLPELALGNALFRSKLTQCFGKQCIHATYPHSLLRL